MADYAVDDDTAEYDERDLNLIHEDLVNGRNVSRRVIWKNASSTSPQDGGDVHRKAPRRPSAARESNHNGFGRIRVLVRCRPLLDSEKTHKSERLQVEPDAVTVRHPLTMEGKRFGFDRVFPPEAEQHDVFAEIQPMIEHVLNGFHATVFAYGQTGSGKTYTMDGLTYSLTKQGGVTVPIPDPDTPVERHGVLLRAIQMIFDTAAARRREHTDANTGEPMDGCPTFEFKCSFLQIYNEKITDLLQSNTESGRKGALGSENSNALALRWLKGDVFRPQNLFICECETPSRMRESFFKGVKEKVVASHLMNQQSSRSHTIFTIYVVRRDAKTNDILSRSEFSLVDLAGSEKLKQVATDNRSKIAKESIEINTSLLALGKVILALANAKGKKGAHIPYRESKLTKLLKHAVGGNSLTTMIACISPSDAYIDETVSTMLYAGRAKNIENAPKVNEDPNFAIIRQLREEIRQLKEELQYYRVLAAGGVQKAESEWSAQRGSGGNAETEKGAVIVAGDTSMTIKEKSDLADSLLSACEMLKRIIDVNGKLRDTFETMKAENDAAATREMHLNAENLALRERIEMLESIVLNDEFLDENGNVKKPEEIQEESASSEEESEKEEEDSTPLSSKPRRSPRAENTPVPVVMSKRATPRLPHSNSTSVEEISTLPPFDAASYRSNITLKDPPASLDRHVNNGNTARSPDVLEQHAYYVTGSPNEKGAVSMHRPPATAGNSQRSPAPPPAGSARVPMSQRGPKKKKSATTRSAERIYGARTRKPSKQKKKMAKQLQEYDQRYRKPAVTPTYADYYGRARPVGTNKSKATIEEMDQVLKKLPSHMTTEFIPSSLRPSGNFGDLTFVGSQDEIAELQRKRMEREEKLRSLMMRNRELNMIIQSEVTGTAPPRANNLSNSSSNRNRPFSGDRYLNTNTRGDPYKRPNTTSGVVRSYKQQRSSSGRNYRLSSPNGSRDSGVSPTRPPFSATLPPSKAYTDKGFEEYNARLRQMLFDDEMTRARYNGEEESFFNSGRGY